MLIDTQPASVTSPLPPTQQPAVMTVVSVYVSIVSAFINTATELVHQGGSEKSVNMCFLL